jgi:hypothetical protein
MKLRTLKVWAEEESQVYKSPEIHSSRQEQVQRLQRDFLKMMFLS